MPMSMSESQAGISNQDKGMIISLAGMPGSGKSSVGRELAALLGCAFIDLDDRIEAQQGRSIPEIFRRYGEAHFRAVELETLKEVLADHPQQPQQSRTGTEGTTGMTETTGAAGTTGIAGTANTTGGTAGTTETAGLADDAAGTIRTADAARTTEAAGTTVMADTAALAEAAGGITGRPALVLSLGGGTLTTAEGEELVAEKTFCIFLKTSPATLAERLRNEKDHASRPLLNGENIASRTVLKGENIASRPASGDGNPQLPPGGEEQQLSPDCGSGTGQYSAKNSRTGHSISGSYSAGHSRTGQQPTDCLRSRLAVLLASRKGIYEKTARLTVETDGLNVKEVAALAADRLALTDSTSADGNQKHNRTATDGNRESTRKAAADGNRDLTLPRTSPGRIPCGIPEHASE